MTAGNNLTPQEKSARGLPLSTADIEALLKDPNSWIAQLYNESQLLAARLRIELTELAFIRYVEAMLQEDRLARAQLDASKENAREARAYASSPQPQLQPTVAATLAPSASMSETLDALMDEQKTLLATPQANMTQAQLTAHHQQVMTNFSNQISARLGPKLTLPLGAGAKPVTLVVPQMASKPPAPLSLVMARNPGLNAMAKANPKVQEGLVVHNAKASTGYFASLNKMREILEANREHLQKIGIDIDNINLTPAQMKHVDIETKAGQTPGLINHLIENFKLSLASMEAKPEAKQEKSTAPTPFKTTPKPSDFG